MRSLLGSLGGSLTSMVNRVPISYVNRSKGLGNIFGAGAVQGDPENQMAQMGSVGTLFAIVDDLASDVASIDWHMHRTGRNVSKKSVCELCDQIGVEQVREHQALKVWNRPNNFYTGQEFRESSQQHYELTGEAWWVVEYGDRSRVPVALWPVRPDRMEPVPDPLNFLVGYNYKNPDGTKTPLGLDEVIFTRRPNPLDPYRGMGPVQSIMADLYGAKYTAEWNATFFRNSAEPAGVIQVPQELSDTQFTRLRQQWGEQHKGIRNAHRVGILEAGMQWVDRRYTQKDMEFAELSRLGGDKIREAFRYPKFRLGNVDDVNRNTASESEVLFARSHRVPRLKRLQGRLNASFLPLFGATAGNVEMVYANPIPQDRELDNEEMLAKSKAAQAYIQSGWDGPTVATALSLPVIMMSGWEKPAKAASVSEQGAGDGSVSTDVPGGNKKHRPGEDRGKTTKPDKKRDGDGDGQIDEPRNLVEAVDA